MNSQIAFLVAIQEVDTEIAELKNGIAMIPGQIESGKSSLAEKKKTLDDAMESIKALQKKRLQLEQEVKAENDHTAKIKTKLTAVKTNKEYTAILVEVDAVKLKIGALEDQQLQIMETLEEKEKILPGIKAVYKEEEDKFNEYKSRKDAEKIRMEAELQTAISKRTETIKSLDPILARRYDNVLKRRGDYGIVQLVGHTCQGCFQEILPQMVIEVKTGDKIHECNHCGRFLYWIPEPTETVAPK
jgi:predicted  nucleic acid-binding Zn-ribbon protein